MHKRKPLIKFKLQCYRITIIKINEKSLIKVGIFFGGTSREREISFVGGRTVYDRLDRGLFEPIPIFIDSLGNFIVLNWQYLYKGAIRDFYPPDSIYHGPGNLYIESYKNLSKSQLDAWIDKIGTIVHPHNFKNIIDFAFLCLHGTKGEDGAIQGLLEWCNIPYSGTHILGSAINIDKGIQKKLICQSLINDDIPDNLLKYELLPFNNWQSLKDKNFLYNKLKKKLGLPFVVKSCRQGSSIGVKIIRSEEDFEILVNSCFFITKIDSSYWNTLEVSAKINLLVPKL